MNKSQYTLAIFLINFSLKTISRTFFFSNLHRHGNSFLNDFNGRT